MPITLTVTCDTDEELARFLENLRFERAFAASAKQMSTTYTRGGVKTKAKKEKEEASTQTSKKPSLTRKFKAKSSVSEKKRNGLKSSESGRKPGKLVPIIDAAIADILKKGKPFRSREVTDLVMKKAPDLNENSVTTGVSKRLSESDLRWDQIKDTIGRPYKLYKP